MSIKSLYGFNGLEISKKLCKEGKEKYVEFINEHEFSKDKWVRKFRFKNGLKVIILEDHSSPVVSYQTWFNVGSKFEKKGKTGIAHLFEHLMFKGTKNYPHGVFDRILEKDGAQVNAATFYDWTYYYENLPSNKIETAVKLEADRMNNLILNEEHVIPEIDVVKNERRFRVENDPDGSMYEVLFEMAFMKHNYGHPILGYMEDLNNLKLDDFLNFYKTYYSVNNAVIVVVGDVKTEEILKLIHRYYGKIKSVRIPEYKKIIEPPQKKERIKKLKFPIATEKIKILYKLPPITHKDIKVAEVINEILTGGDSSRLYRKLVIETEIASDVTGWVGDLSEYGVFSISITMNEGHPSEKALKIVEEEFENLRTNNLSQRELEKAKNRLEAEFVRSLVSAYLKAHEIGFFEITAEDYREFFKIIEHYSKVTKQDVRRVLSKYIKPEKRTSVIGIPVNNMSPE